VYNPASSAQSLLIFLLLAGGAVISAVVVVVSRLIGSGLEGMRSSEGALAVSGAGLGEVEEM
jgi:hypothetical protein